MGTVSVQLLKQVKLTNVMLNLSSVNSKSPVNLVCETIKLTNVNVIVNLCECKRERERNLSKV